MFTFLHRFFGFERPTFSILSPRTTELICAHLGVEIERKLKAMSICSDAEKLFEPYLYSIEISEQTCSNRPEFLHLLKNDIKQEKEFQSVGIRFHVILSNCTDYLIKLVDLFGSCPNIQSLSVAFPKDFSFENKESNNVSIQLLQERVTLERLQIFSPSFSYHFSNYLSNNFNALKKLYLRSESRETTGFQVDLKKFPELEMLVLIRFNCKEVKNIAGKLNAIRIAHCTHASPDLLKRHKDTLKEVVLERMPELQNTAWKMQNIVFLSLGKVKANEILDTPPGSEMLNQLDLNWTDEVDTESLKRLLLSTSCNSIKIKGTVLHNSQKIPVQRSVSRVQMDAFKNRCVLAESILFK